MILGFDKSILPDSVALVSPHSSETQFVTLVDIRLGL
jgi:hypothetical protein